MIKGEGSSPGGKTAENSTAFVFQTPDPSISKPIGGAEDFLISTPSFSRATFRRGFIL
jgi:hypothetical protein